jgi:hypothetical protein
MNHSFYIIDKIKYYLFIQYLYLISKMFLENDGNVK